MIAIVVSLAALAFLAALGKRKREADSCAERAKRARALFDQSREFISQIGAAGELPAIEVLTLNLQSGEFAILRDAESKLYVFKTRQVPVGAERRDSFAGISFYPQAWQSEATDEMSAIAAGELYLTNNRLVFVGIDRNMAIAWKDLLAVRATLDQIVVYTGDSQFPVGFTVGNPALWALMIRWMTSAEIKAPRLAPGTRITLEYHANANEIEALITATLKSEDSVAEG